MSDITVSGFMTRLDVPERTPGSLYESDEYAWLEQQAALLRARRLDQIDHASLAEFLAEMAENKRKATKSHLRVLLLHMLKVRYQPDRISGSWRSTIIEQQAQASDEIASSPGMGQHLPTLYAEAYRVARLQAAAETEIEQHVFPVENPWTLEEALSYVPPSQAPHPATPKRRKR